MDRKIRIKCAPQQPLQLDSSWELLDYLLLISTKIDGSMTLGKHLEISILANFNLFLFKLRLEISVAKQFDIFFFYFTTINNFPKN